MGIEEGWWFDAEADLSPLDGRPHICFALLPGLDIFRIMIFNLRVNARAKEWPLFLQSPSLISHHGTCVLLSLLHSGAQIFTFKVPGILWENSTPLLLHCIHSKKTDHNYL